MEEKKYFITREQLETIEHFRNMFSVNADEIKELCNTERFDIVYGFELGQMYSHLRECFFEMIELEENIKKQQIKK